MENLRIEMFKNFLKHFFVFSCCNVVFCNSLYGGFYFESHRLNPPIWKEILIFKPKFIFRYGDNDY